MLICFRFTSYNCGIIPSLIFSCIWKMTNSSSTKMFIICWKVFSLINFLHPSPTKKPHFLNELWLIFKLWRISVKLSKHLFFLNFLTANFGTNSNSPVSFENFKLSLKKSFSYYREISNKLAFSTNSGYNRATNFILKRSLLNLS